MKESNIVNKTGFLKKIFIKICRLFGYEIIDQSKYEIPTLNKSLSDSVSIPGKKSITVPLGEIKITRKIKKSLSELDGSVMVSKINNEKATVYDL